MTITELIKDLEQLKSQYGDLQVLTFNQDWLEYEFADHPFCKELDEDECEYYYNEDWKDTDPICDKYIIPKQFIAI